MLRVSIPPSCPALVAVGVGTTATHSSSASPTPNFPFSLLVLSGLSLLVRSLDTPLNLFHAASEPEWLFDEGVWDWLLEALRARTRVPLRGRVVWIENGGSAGVGWAGGSTEKSWSRGMGCSLGEGKGGGCKNGGGGGGTKTG